MQRPACRLRTASTEAKAEQDVTPSATRSSYQSTGTDELKSTLLFHSRDKVLTRSTAVSTCYSLLATKLGEGRVRWDSCATSKDRRKEHRSSRKLSPPWAREIRMERRTPARDTRLIGWFTFAFYTTAADGESQGQKGKGAETELGR